MSEGVTPPSEEQIRDAVNRRKTKVEEYLQDPDKTRRLLEEAVHKANDHEGKPGQKPDFWMQLKAFFRLLRAYTNREYTVVPWGSIVMVTIAILYFVSPIDLIPDWLPLAGFVDDAAVILFVIRQLKQDIDGFLAWENAQKNPGGQIIDL
ncbi:MAG TPA: YkvA family protein [Anaerolineaceae bacterium]|nr:YkvA family protein [Anaerolineaceae bacterium]